MAVSRETIRDALAALLTTTLEGTGKPCQKVYGYQVADFGGQSPVVTVSGAGSERERFTHQGNRATFYLNVHVFVLYSNPSTVPPWTEADAEDRLDLIEQTIAATLETNRKYAGYWQAADYAERSQAGALDLQAIGGDEYRMEVIPLKFEVYG